MKTLNKQVKKSADLRNWLEKIREAHPQKKLLAKDVVEAARDAKSPGHSHFTWNDANAAAKCRMMEARQLIRTVYVIDQDSGNKTPAFVSLLPDREKPDGGYRSTSEVVSNDALRAQLELTAKKELRGWTERYQLLTGLVDSVANAAGIDPPNRKKRSA